MNVMPCCQLSVLLPPSILFVLTLCINSVASKAASNDLRTQLISEYPLPLFQDLQNRTKPPYKMPEQPIFMDKSVVRFPNYRVTYYESPNQFGYWDQEMNEFHVWVAPTPTFGAPWPLPKEIQQYPLYYQYDPQLQIVISKTKNYVLESAVSRFSYTLTQAKAVSYYPFDWRSRDIGSAEMDKKFNGFISKITIAVAKGGQAWPHLHMDESYRLRVKRHIIMIKSGETWGALRALETLLQLSWRTEDGRIFVNESMIRDEPEFPHRGLLVDTARHYMDKRVLLNNLDAMAMNKMNVFHWHIVDDQSFPFVSKSLPKLSSKGSYGEGRLVYTPNDIDEILEYARLRGIRVIPEFDTPGHTLSWGRGYPELLTKCFGFDNHWSGYLGPLDPVNNNTYAFLRTLFDDILNSFPDEYLHLGGDEVGVTCWSTEPKIRKLMEKYDMPTPSQMNDYYFRRLQNIITEEGLKDESKLRSYIVWQDAFDNGIKLKNGTIIQYWKSENPGDMFEAVNKGFRVLYTGCWYLDHYQRGVEWVKFYSCALDKNTFGSQTTGKILGGEAAMWSEYQTNATILRRIWPLTNAVAERLWSTRDTGSMITVAERMEEQRCRMVIRGIPVAAGGGPGACPHELYNAPEKPYSWDTDMDFSFLQQKLTNLLDLLDMNGVDIRLPNGERLSYIEASNKYYKITHAQLLALIICPVLVLLTVQWIVRRARLKGANYYVFQRIIRLTSTPRRVIILGVPLLGLISLLSMIYYALLLHGKKEKIALS